MKEKNILITAGPTNEYIDEVMKITNMSTGRLGIELTKNYLNEGAHVTLIATRSVFRSGLFEKYKLQNNPNLKGIPIETTEDMFKALENESKNKYNLVIHSSAVGDYKPEFSFKMEDLADELAIAIAKTVAVIIIAFLCTRAASFKLFLFFSSDNKVHKSLISKCIGDIFIFKNNIVKAAFCTCMTGRTLFFDKDGQSIGITVSNNLYDMLNIARCFAFSPQLLT